eukprot:6573641-Pyramimonas_sp.AAC.1
MGGTTMKLFACDTISYFPGRHHCQARDVHRVRIAFHAPCFSARVCFIRQAKDAISPVTSPQLRHSDTDHLGETSLSENPVIRLRTRGVVSVPKTLGFTDLNCVV